jgi:hypothetical protein
MLHCHKSRRVLCLRGFAFTCRWLRERSSSWSCVSSLNVPRGRPTKPVKLLLTAARHRSTMQQTCGLKGTPGYSPIVLMPRMAVAKWIAGRGVAGAADGAGGVVWSRC